MATGSECLELSTRFGFSGAPSNCQTPNGQSESPETGDDDATATVPETNTVPDGANDPETAQGRRKTMGKPDTIQLLNVRGLANHCEPRNIRRGKLDFLKDELIEEN